MNGLLIMIIHYPFWRSMGFDAHRMDRVPAAPPGPHLSSDSLNVVEDLKKPGLRKAKREFLVLAPNLQTAEDKFLTALKELGAGDGKGWGRKCPSVYPPPCCNQGQWICIPLPLC